MAGQLHLGDVTAGLKLKDVNFTSGIKGAAGELGGLAAKLGVGFSVAGLGRAFDTVTGMSSDLKESLNVVQASFGALAPATLDWARTTAKEVGRSRKQLIGMAGDMGALLKPMVGNEALAQDMSQEMSKPAVDMGSFFNAVDQDVLVALRSGLSGEAEPLKRFGIVMNVAALDAFALASGLGKTTKQMTEAEKTTLRYNFILEKTKDAQGDAAKTADGLANMQKRAAGLWEDAMTDVGAVLEPVKKLLVQSRINTLEWFNTLSDSEKSAGVAAISVGVLAAAVVGLGVAFGPMIVGAIGAALPFIAIGAAIAGVVLLIGALKVAWDKDLGGIATTTKKRLEEIAQFWSTTMSWIDMKITKLRDLMIDKFVAAFSGVEKILAAFLANISETFSKLPLGIGGPMAKAAKLASEAIDKLGLKSLGEILKKKTVGTLLGDGLKLVTDKMKEGGGDIGTALLDGLKESLGGVKDLILEAFPELAGILDLDKLLGGKGGKGGGLTGGARGKGGAPIPGLTDPQAADRMITTMKDLKRAYLQGAVQAAGRVGGVGQAAFQAGATGGPLAALATVGTALLTSSEAFKRNMDRIDAVFQDVANVVGAVTEAVAFLSPLFWLFKVQLELLGLVSRKVTEGLQSVGKFFKKLGAGVLNKLGFKGAASKIRASMRGVAQSFEDIHIDIAQAAASLDFAEARRLATEHLEDLGEAARATASALTNVPVGFKVAAARFAAIQRDGEVVRGEAAAPPIHIENMHVNANDSDEFAESMTKKQRRHKSRRRGSP